MPTVASPPVRPRSGTCPPTGSTYTFNLRGTDKWTNGDTVTSADFKNSWLRMLDPATAADYAYQLYFIKGAEDYNGGKGTADQVAIDATDPKVLKVTLKAPTPWFVPTDGATCYFPIPPKTVEQFGEKWTEPANIVTNGPYKLTTWNHDSDLTLEKWADWRDAANVTLTLDQDGHDQRGHHRRGRLRERRARHPARAYRWPTWTA